MKRLVLLLVLLALRSVSLADCLYNDAHLHIQDFKAEGPRVPDILKPSSSRKSRKGAGSGS